MQTSLPQEDLERYILRLLATHLPDGATPPAVGRAYFARAFERLEHCFSRIHRKYYEKDGKPVFDHLNGDHMASLLYFFANTVWREANDEGMATRLFYLNKIMHGLDLFYSVKMPDVFLLVHPLGTILGNATYSDYLVVYQNVTVGAVTTVYPKFGEGTILYARAGVIGSCESGNNVVFAANSFIVDQRISADTVVVGQYPSHRLVPNRQPVRARCFDRS
jgi:serine O-acetyltransferase